MAVQPPTPDQIRDAARAVGLSLGEDEVRLYAALMAPSIAAYQLVDAMPDEVPEVRYPRTPGRWPTQEENRHNAWYVRTSIRGAPDGPLAGKRIAVKDNVMVAGVPMMNGCSVLEGYVPEVDATVITRLLDAGAEIVGKTHCENFCLSGGSHTNAKGPVHNPHRFGYSSGGSSSGSAVAVALGEADMAVGGDQGGSIRLPSAWSGICGMKPTYGLVPYTGIMPMEVVVDHAGPMTANVADNALMLEVMAGHDGYDPRQSGPDRRERYTDFLDLGVQGLRVAVLREGFARPESDPASDAKVAAAIQVLRDLGAEVTEVSVPEHLLGPALLVPIGVEGVTQTMLRGAGFGLSRPDLYVTSLMDRLHGWELRAGELSPTVKIWAVLGTYVQAHHGPRGYGKASNLTRRLRAAYDRVLATHDLLVMPTIPMPAQPIPSADAGLEEIVGSALPMIGNTSPFNLSHHPAMSVPCGRVDGLPVGLMLVGRHFDEGTIYRAAHAFEQAADWTTL
jgi:amidase